ncbi:MAG: hypothetical protein R2849_19530 [Thermomicrobiales bacterium]
MKPSMLQQWPQLGGNIQIGLLFTFRRKHLENDRHHGGLMPFTDEQVPPKSDAARRTANGRQR